MNGTEKPKTRFKAQMKQMPRAEKKNSTLYLRPVPTGVKSHFKSECAKRGLTMLEAHVEFMRNAIALLPDIVKMKQKREREEAFVRGE